MAEESGVSASYVDSAIDAAVSELRSYIDREIARLESAMEHLADRVVSAIRSQTDSLSSEMDKQTAAIVAQALLNYKLLASTRENLVNELTSTRDRLTHEFGETRQNLSLKTEADLQIDLAGKISDVVSTRAKINAFVADIASRFDKSVEGIFLNRQLYNHNFKKIFDEYYNKIRTIAQHIYDIAERDFTPATKAALASPEQVCELPIEVDLMRLKLRAESLDECIELLKATRLDDILLSLQKLSNALENEFRVPVGQGEPAETVHCVYGIHVRSQGEQTLVLQSSLAVMGDGALQRIALTPPTNDFKRYHEGGARRALESTLKQRPDRLATEEEKASLRAATARLVSRGKVSAENRALLEDFLGRELLNYTE